MSRREMMYKSCAALFAAVSVCCSGAAHAGAPFNYRIPVGATLTAGAAATPAATVPPAISYQFYQWPSWFAKTADGYLIDLYTYDNNRDGQLDGTRVGLLTPNAAYSINLANGARTVQAVEPLSPGLAFDTGPGVYGGNCFQAGMSPAPSVNNNGVACYIYPRYTVQKAGENKVAFKIIHSLGEDVVGMAFYGYDAPTISSDLPSTLGLGTVPMGYSANLTFQVQNSGQVAGKITSSPRGSWAIAQTCQGASLAPDGVLLNPGASCSVTVSWQSSYKASSVIVADMLGVPVSSISTVSWTN